MAPRSPLAALVIASALLLAAVVGLTACGSTTTTTAGSVLSTGPQPTGVTVSPSSSGTTVAVATGTSGETSPYTTAINTGTTAAQIEGNTRTLTFLEPATPDTWRAVREIVMNAKGDGQKVLDQVANLAAGPPVDVSSNELDAVSGIGFAAGADTSQPVGVAIGDDGHQVLVFAFGVTGNPAATTIAGFERQTNLVGLVEGPLPISSATGNLTTIPST